MQKPGKMPLPGGLMNSKRAWIAAMAMLISGALADTASAQSTLNLSVGAFVIRGEDARIDGDALVVNRDIYRFDFGDFTTLSLNGEWLVPIGDYLEAGGGIGFTSRTVPTVYDRFERPDGSEIEQELKLRTIPMTATVRVLPFGRNRVVEPYVGGGIGFINWRYSETGDFIDFTLPGRPVFPASYTETGTSIGPVAVFGLRVPLGNLAIGGEVRYQKAEGDLDERDFLAPKIDLGGFHYMATVGFRF
jgi:hypothetical protein